MLPITATMGALGAAVVGDIVIGEAAVVEFVGVAVA
jgi:hypothetical protein